jgi:hypothetical protein
MWDAMTWVDQKSYFGPDRRQRGGTRFLDRRREETHAPPPPLLTAMRQLRQRAIDAHGAGAADFAARVAGIAELARYQGEQQAAEVLMRLAHIAMLGKEMDVRPDIIDMLDRAHEALNAPDA